MSGKGDTQRPATITHAEYSARYAGTFCADFLNDPPAGDVKMRFAIYISEAEKRAAHSKVVPPANCASDRGVR